MNERVISSGIPAASDRLRRLAWIVGLAVGFNVLAWAGSALWPAAATNGAWRTVSLLGCFLIGALIGRPWALWVTLAWGGLHAIPVYLGLLPGYLSTWGEALWWAFALALLTALTGLGVVTRLVAGWIIRRLGG